MSQTTATQTDARATRIAIVDYGLGNIRSVTRGLERGGAAVELIDDPGALENADGIVLPGVGAFREGVENAGPFREPLLAAAEAGTPVFGICLGMQMLLTSSEESAHVGEGEVTGLALVPGRNVRFPTDRKVPHMGWNRLELQRAHPVFEGIDGGYAYFVHSYFAAPEDPDAVVATTDYGLQFPAIIANESGNVFGTQFHPEKSGEIGLRILENFVAYCAD